MKQGSLASRGFGAFRDDSLTRNSTHLIASTVVSALGGFLFWTISARLASPTDVGVAATLVASANLISMLGLVGMDMSVLHFTEKSPASRERTLSAGCLVVGLATVLCAIVFVTGHRVFTPRLRVLDNPAADIAFVVLALAVSVNSFADSMFIALRQSRFALLRNLVVNGLRVVTPLVTAAMLGFGLFVGYALPAVIGLALGVVLLARLGVPVGLKVHGEQLRSMWRYSAGNYVALSLSNAPPLILPVIIAAGLGPRAAAIWTLPALVAGVVSAVPNATAQSFFAEVSADPENAGRHLSRVIQLTMIYQLPVLAGVLVLGWPVLRLFGPAYTHGFLVLVVLSVSGLLGSVGYVCRTLLLTTDRLRRLAVASSVFCVISTLGAAAVVHLGINAVALSWLAAEIVTAVLYIWLVRDSSRQGRPRPVSSGQIVGSHPRPSLAMTSTMRGDQ